MRIENDGDNNVVTGRHDHIAGSITFIGNSNFVVIGEGATAQAAHITASHGSSIVIGSTVNLGLFTAYTKRSGEIRIGDGCGFGQVDILLHEPSSVVVGSGCLFSHGVKMVTSDMHPIFDIASGKRVNPAASIELGKRVWLGEGVQVLPGSKIGAGSIIGIGSLVKGEVPSNVVAAGRPAKILREGVQWEFELPN